MSKNAAIQSASANLALRKKNLHEFIRRMAQDAEALAAKLHDHATTLHVTEENADEKFIDAITAYENFSRNISMAQANRLVGRYASAEVDLNNLLS